jgi:hypothetical protein
MACATDPRDFLLLPVLHGAFAGTLPALVSGLTCSREGQSGGPCRPSNVLAVSPLCSRRRCVRQGSACVSDGATLPFHTISMADSERRFVAWHAVVLVAGYLGSCCLDIHAPVKGGRGNGATEEARREEFCFSLIL